MGMKMRIRVIVCRRYVTVVTSVLSETVRLALSVVGRGVGVSTSTWLHIGVLFRFALRFVGKDKGCV